MTARVPAPGIVEHVRGVRALDGASLAAGAGGVRAPFGGATPGRATAAGSGRSDAGRVPVPTTPSAA